MDPSGHSWKSFFKAAAIAVVGVALAVVTGGAGAVALLGTWGSGVLTGAVIGATVGGATAAAMGGNIGQGMLIGGISGAVFAGLAPAFNSFSSGIARGITMGGASGPMTLGTTMASNFASNFAAGAVAGGVAGAMSGGNVGRAAMIGGAFAGGMSILSDTATALMSTAQAENSGRVWVGSGEDQSNVMSMARLHSFTDNANITFVRNPSFQSYKAALQSNYSKVLLNTHGGPTGLLFSDGVHSLRELAPIANRINAGRVGIAACFPKVQSVDWATLNVYGTSYVDLSATTMYTYPLSSTVQNAENVYTEATTR